MNAIAEPIPFTPEEPLPLFPELPPAEPFPSDALGPILSPAAKAIARKVQVPEAIAAQSVLAAAALAAQAHADVLLPFGQTRPLSLFFVTVAASGDRKSTADNEALWPVRKRERTMKDIWEEELQHYRVAATAYAAEKRKIEADKKATLISRKADLAALGPEPKPPLHPFLTAPEPTIEGLIKAWINAPAALGIFSAEGGMFVGGHGMNEDNRLKSAAAYSELWDGASIKRIRSLDGVAILQGRRLSMHLMVQHQAAAQFLADPLLRDQGLLSRVLVAAPESIAGTRLYRDPTPEDDAAIRKYGARILSLLEAPWPLREDARNELEPRALPMSAEATAVWIKFFDHVEQQCGPEGELRAIGDFAAKSAEHAARLAGVLSVVQNLQATEIDLAAMQSAVMVADWYIHEAIRLHQAGRTDASLVKAKRLLDWLQDRDESEIPFREILQFGPKATRTKKEAEAALRVLEQHGWTAEVSDRPRRVRVARGAGR